MQLPNIDKLTVEELWNLYGATHDQLRKLGEIRSRNIVGDRGEQLAITHYNATKNLPKLQMAPPSTKNIDAISTRGDRYSIKTMTLPNKTTGAFYGYEPNKFLPIMVDGELANRSEFISYKLNRLVSKIVKR
jgi:hypothetical protein